MDDLVKRLRYEGAPLSAMEREREEAADRIESLERALRRAEHYIGNCGVDIERDYPEIAAAILRCRGAGRSTGG